jgi:hypothetical protein
MAYLQCPKRLWLEIHRPERHSGSSATTASFAIGKQIGDVHGNFTTRKVLGYF